MNEGGAETVNADGDVVNVTTNQSTRSSWSDSYTDALTNNAELG